MTSFCPRDHGCSLPAGHDGDCELTAALCFCDECEAKAVSQPVGLHCPGCGQPPIIVLDDGRQCFCGNETDCHVIMWDSTKTLAELNADAEWHDLSGWNEQDARPARGERTQGSQRRLLRRPGPGPAMTTLRSWRR